MPNQHMRPLHIAHVLVGKFLGGMERYVLELCARIATRGFTNCLLVPHDSPLIEAARQCAIPCVPVPIRGDVNFLTPARIAHWLRGHQIDLLNVHDNGAAIPCSLGGRLAGIPVVGTVHAFHGKWPFLAADHLITVSAALRRHLQTQGFRDAQISLVRSGVDLDHFAPRPRAEARKALGLPLEGFYFAYVGRLAYGKGLAALVDAFAVIAQRNPRAHLLFAGSGQMENAVRDRVAQKNLGDAVQFLGFQADVRPVLAAADCLVLPSESEGLPLILLEAMASARAMLATEVGGMPEIVCDGETGLLIPPCREDRLLQAMTRLLDEPEWTTTLGINARHRAEIEHPISKQIEGTEAVYRRMVKA